MNTPISDRIAARRAAAQPLDHASTTALADTDAAPPTRAPFVPEWRRRAIEAQAQARRDHGTAFVAVLDTTSLA